MKTEIETNETELTSVLRQTLKKYWSIEGDLRPLGTGSTAHTWQIDDKVIKLATDNLEHFNAGLRASLAVEAAGIQTGAPLRTNSGDLSVEFELHGKRRMLAVLQKVDGSPLSAIASPHILGLLLGRCHAALRTVDQSGAWTVDDVLGHMRRGIVSSQPLTTQRMIAQAIESVQGWYDQVKPPLQMIRGDGPEILSKDGTGISAIIDWGGVRSGSVADDIGCWTVHGVTESVSLVQYTAEFLAAYETVNKITTAEKDAIPLFQQLRVASRACYTVDPETLVSIEKWIHNISL